MTQKCCFLAGDLSKNTTQLLVPVMGFYVSQSPTVLKLSRAVKKLKKLELISFSSDFGRYQFLPDLDL